MKTTLGAVRRMVREALQYRTSDVLATVRSLNRGGRIPLAKIRPELDSRGIPRGEQDKALIALQRADQLVLYRNDNPRELTSADRDAALYVGDSPRHLVYLTN